MKICYVGNFRSFTARGEAINTEAHLAASLESIGHQVVRLQEDKQTAAGVVQRVRDEKAGLLLWTRTWPHILRAGGIEMLRDVPCPSVAYHLDLYAGLPRSRDIDDEPWWRCKYVFTADGGSDDFWRAHGVNHFWAPPGVYGPECYLAEPGPVQREIVFVGSTKGYHPEWSYREKLINWLRATYGDRFTVFGRGCEVECVRGSELNELYASTKVVIGDSLCLGYNHANYWSDRVTETLGRGGFLLHPAIAGMEKHFEDGKHLAYYQFENWSGLRHLIDYYLAHGDEREFIRRTGHEHVKAHHTYLQRMAWMLETVTTAEAAETAKRMVHAGY